MKKYLNIFTCISIFSCFATSLFADTTLIVLNNQGCFNCYADVSNLKNEDFVYVHIKGYSEDKTKKFVNKYFEGFGFKSTQWCPPELEGLEGVASVSKGSIDHFLPLGLHYSATQPKMVNLGDHILSESLVYSVSQNSFVIKDKAFNECIIIQGDNASTINFSDSIIESTVYAKLDLLAEKKLIEGITKRLGGGLNQHLVMGDVKIFEGKIHTLVSIRRFTDNTLYTEPAVIVMNKYKEIAKVVTFPKGYTYRIGTRTFRILKNGDYRFVVTPPGEDKKITGYKFIYTFSNQNGRLEPVDTLDMLIDSNYDGLRNKFNSSSIHSVNGLWAYTAIPVFFDTEDLSNGKLTEEVRLSEYKKFRLGRDDKNVFHMDYKFKGITQLSKGKYLILYRYLDELKFKIITENKVIGFGKLGENQAGSNIFLVGNEVYFFKNGELFKKPLFSNL